MHLKGVESNDLCIPNISTSERRKRLAFGGVLFFFTLAVLAGMMAFGVNRWWRVLLLPMFGGAASGFFQWRDHT